MLLDLTEFQITDKNFIGHGAVWNVYRHLLKNGKSLIIKVNILRSKTSAKRNVDNFNLIKSLDFPTLKFLYSEKFKNNLILVGEDLNYGDELIYVSPNSISYTSPLYRDDELTFEERLVIDYLNAGQMVNTPKAEMFRFENKLIEITNLELFITQSLVSLKGASEMHVGIDFDSYFFGSIKRQVSSELTLIIADFDHIELHKKCTVEEVLTHNISEFKRALTSFVFTFTEEVILMNYIKIIEKMCK